MIPRAGWRDGALREAKDEGSDSGHGRSVRSQSRARRHARPIRAIRTGPARRPRCRKFRSPPSGPVLHSTTCRTNGRTTPKVSALVSKLSARKTPLDEAEKSVKEFLAGSAADKTANAKLLFAGLFDTLNAQRSQVMSGLERVSRKQREAADKIREESRPAPGAPGRDAARRRQGRCAQQRADLEDPHFRGPPQGGAVRLRGSDHDRPAPVRARTRDPAGNGIASASLTTLSDRFPRLHRHH